MTFLKIVEQELISEINKVNKTRKCLLAEARK